MKVCIIGAGIAGLYTAYKLLNEGVEVVMYERSKRVGGRIKTVMFDGKRVVAGAGVGRKREDKLLLRLCGELGVKVSMYKAESMYEDGIEVEFSIDKKLRDLRRVMVEDDKRKTFREVGEKYWGAEEYNKFVMYVGETDYERSCVMDVLNDYGFELNRGFSAFSVDWEKFLVAFERRLVSLGVKIRTGAVVGSIDRINGGYMVESGGKKERYDMVVIATAIESSKKLLRGLIGERKLKEYESIGCQPFVRLYVKLDRELDMKARLMIVRKPLQKIIEMDKERRIYMISYSDNASAMYWRRAYEEGVLERKVVNEINEVFGMKVRVLKQRLIWWECGTHYFRGSCEGRDEYLERVQRPVEDVYVVGEAFSRNQGWCEGALESVEQIFSK